MTEQVAEDELPRCEHTDIRIDWCAHCLGHKEWWE